jgi:hypothetical protein
VGTGARLYCLPRAISTNLTNAAHHRSQIGQEMCEVRSVFVALPEAPCSPYRADCDASCRWPTAVGSVGTGAKDGESSAGRVWAAGFHHVTARSSLAGVWKLMYRNFLIFKFCFSGRCKPWINKTTDTQLVGTGHECIYTV